RRNRRARRESRDIPSASVGDDRGAACFPSRAEAQGGPSRGFLEPAAERFPLHGDEVGGARISVEWRMTTNVSANHPGRWWHRLPDGRVQCGLCPRDCRLHEGQRGACFVRQREGDAIVLTTYGRSSGFCIDPIEKKPLNHFYPGSSVFSFGTAGC